MKKVESAKNRMISAKTKQFFLKKVVNMVE
jgi:hypothetical protein